jgi:hypothetical protein
MDPQHYVDGRKEEHAQKWATPLPKLRRHATPRMTERMVTQSAVTVIVAKN